MPEQRTIQLSKLQAGRYFSAPVYLDEKYLLLSPETPFTDELKQLLRTWEYKQVYTAGDEVETPQSGSASAEVGEDVLTTSTIDDAVKDRETWATVRKIYNEFADFTEKLFTNFVAKEEMSQVRISEKLKEILEHLRTYRPYMLRLTEIRGMDKNYIVMQSVKTTVLALACGQAMKLPPHRLIELGTASLLHEIGMIRLPSKLYMSDQPLTEQERKAISAHPVLGFKILRSLSFPMAVCLAVLESHERIDGNGYPRRLPGEKISTYARIIFACDSYSAQVSKRPFRAARDGHSSILELLKERGTAYDEQVLRVLLQLISVYPVGTFVELENKSRGIVVETNPDDPRYPFVRILASPEGKSYVDPPTVRTSAEGYHIQRTLSAEEIEPLQRVEAGGA